MFIADDPTPLLLRSEERHHHRISGRKGVALPKGAKFFLEFVAINIPLLRSEDDTKLIVHDEARDGFVTLFGALR